MIVPTDLTIQDIANALNVSGVHGEEASMYILRDVLDPLSDGAPNWTTSTSLTPSEVNAVDTMIGFWLLTLTEDEIIDVGQICTDSRPGDAPEWKLANLLRGSDNHESRMEALCLMFGSQRMREVMATVANDPARLGLDDCDAVANAIIPLLITEELPF